MKRFSASLTATSSCSSSFTVLLLHSTPNLTPSSASPSAHYNQRRGYVNAYYRPPLRQSIPTHTTTGGKNGTGGEPIDPDLFLEQLKNMMLTLQQSQLIEKYFEMKPIPYLEASFTSDAFASLKGVVVVMPKYGREHRSSEMSETLRYLRGSGANNDFNTSLQDARGATAHGGDFVATTHGLLMGWGTSRTNKIAMNVMTAGKTEDGPTQQTQVAGYAMADPIELSEDSPPLADLVAFAGSRTLLARGDAFGREAARKVTLVQNRIPWQVVPVDPGCNVLSFMAGSLPVYDVLCDIDFPETMDRLANAGLNPMAVEWSEPRKLGYTMRQFCLIVRFSMGAGPGGFRDSMSHVASERNYVPSQKGKGRWINQQKTSHGDQGAPLLAQLRAGEIPEPVKQSPPRYRPPMHRNGSIVPSSSSGGK